MTTPPHDARQRPSSIASPSVPLLEHDPRSPDRTADRQPDRGDHGPGLAAVRRLVDGYTEAFNRRDVEGILEQFDAAIAFSPTKLSGDGNCYRGHDGVREWMDSVLANPIPYRSRVAEVRLLADDRWIVVGDVLVHDEPTSPYVFTVRVRNRLISELTSSLSDEELLRHLGRLP